jgi:O-antigen/teichoic acid export membrane protein
MRSIGSASETDDLTIHSQVDVGAMEVSSSLISVRKRTSLPFNIGGSPWGSPSMSSERRRLLLGTSWTLASTFVALVAGTILNPVLVLYLGVGGFGTWASAIAFASIFGLAGDLGVAAALTKTVAERRGVRRGIESMGGSALMLAFAAGSAAGFALFATSYFMAGFVNSVDFPSLLRLQAVQMPVNLGSASLLALLQGDRRFRSLSMFTMLQSLGSVALVGAALAVGGGIVGAMAASVAATVAGFVVLFYSRRNELHFAGAAMLSADFRRLVPFGVQLTAMNALSTVLYQADIVLLSALTGDATVVGIYALAVFSTRILWIIPGSISVTTYPVVSEYAAAADSIRMNRYLSGAILASLTVVGSLGSAFLLFGRPLLRVFFGADSVGAYDLAIPMLLGTAVLGALRSIAPSLTSVGRPDVGLGISALGAGVLVVLAYALTRAYGASGAAIAVSTSFIISSIALVASIERFVVRPAGGRLRSRRLGITGASAAVVGGVSSLLALPAEPALFNIAWAIGLWSGLILVLIVASGGRKTWGGIFRGAGPAPERVP